MNTREANPHLIRDTLDLTILRQSPMHWGVIVLIGEIIHKNLLHWRGRGNHFTLNPKNPDRPLVLKIRLSGFPTLFKCHPSNMVGALLNRHHLKLGLLCKIIPKSFCSVENRRTLRENSQFNVDRTSKNAWDNHHEGKERKKGPKRSTPKILYKPQTRWVAKETKKKPPSFPSRQVLTWGRENKSQLYLQKSGPKEEHSGEVTLPIGNLTSRSEPEEKIRADTMTQAKNPRQGSFFIFKVNGQAPVRAVQCLPIYRPNPTHG